MTAKSSTTLISISILQPRVSLPRIGYVESGSSDPAADFSICNDIFGAMVERTSASAKILLTVHLGDEALSSTIQDREEHLKLLQLMEAFAVDEW